MVNGMIGGTCLVLPHIGLKTGWTLTIIVSLVIGYISYYTAYLIILHLGRGTQIKDCIMAHFNDNYKYMQIYCFFIWVSFIPMMLIYFRIICLQIQALMGHESGWVGPLVAIGLMAGVIIIRIQRWGEETLAYGVISIIGYLAFLVWAQFTAPTGPRDVIPLGSPV